MEEKQRRAGGEEGGGGILLFGLLIFKQIHDAGDRVPGRLYFRASIGHVPRFGHRFPDRLFFSLGPTSDGLRKSPFPLLLFQSETGECSTAEQAANQSRTTLVAVYLHCNNSDILLIS